MVQKKILIIAGEPSGDLHASSLVRDIRSIDSGVSFFGIGGDGLKREGAKIVFDISELALVGLVEVLKNIFIIRRAFNAVLSAIDSEKPELAILVDYPGFNLRLAKELKRRGIPVVYYISPQVWAWGRDRVNIIKGCVKKMLVFFKFEAELYKAYGVDAEFVGNPLIDAVRVTEEKDVVLEKLGLSFERKTIALLPGSRKMEICNFLPTMAKAADIISERLPHTQFIVAKHPSIDRRIYQDAIAGCRSMLVISEGDTYNTLGASDFAVVASGTATLETAIIGTPLVIIYKVNLLTYILYKLVSNTRFIGIVNILANREIAPEILQYDLTPEKISERVISIIPDEKKISEMRASLKAVVSGLGAPGASMRAARSIHKLLTQNN